MGTKKQKRVNGWKATREGKRAHYFEAFVDDLDRSLCSLIYDWEQLEPITIDILRPGDYCKRCVNKYGPV